MRSSHFLLSHSIFRLAHNQIEADYHIELFSISMYIQDASFSQFGRILVHLYHRDDQFCKIIQTA